MKITNYQALILLELEDSNPDGGIWREDLAERLNTPTSTLYDNLKKLKEKKKLVDKYKDKYKKSDEQRGRSRIYWYITNLGKRAVKVIQKGINNKD
ncbi:hypothetical protein LCGC14_1067710 [marine sediment metagenome]|uniref:Uncharacterized protein n=1 Tax=marine sediment metagenome TaxID=412755 RepID=A0A0F9N6B3_9ZZZZ